jgi:aldose 1-epimerase
MTFSHVRRVVDFFRSSGFGVILKLQTNLTASRKFKRRENMELVRCRAFFIMLLGVLTWPATAISGAIVIEAFGQTAKGQAVSKITMVNDRNMTVSLMSYGATLTAIKIPDRHGQARNIVLSLPDVPSYELSQRRWGSIIGRYAGRISDAQFNLDGRVFRLEPGRNGVTLHGGSDGYDKRVWSYQTRSDRRSMSTVFTLLSYEGDQGFPGALTLEVTYRLMRASNELRIEYRATTTAPTVVNFTNHVFLNLAGAGNGTINSHELTLMTPLYAPTDARKIPTGQLLSVSGTPLDFRTSRLVGQFLESADPLLVPSKGYDHSYAFAASRHRSTRTIALLHDPASGRRMTILTTEPGLQFNSGNGFEGKEIGSEGVAYPIYAGVALETQHLPDSPNQPLFPSTRLDPGKPFYSVTTYRFATE